MSLHVLGNNKPSLDIICNTCCKKFEIKSKCLSVKNLPLDLIMPHGNYFDYLRSHEDNLDFIIIIYGVDRKQKNIIIKKILHVPNKMINQNDMSFRVIKNDKDDKSMIHIKNHKLYKNII